MHIIYISLIVSTPILVGITLLLPAYGDTINPGIYAVDSKPFNKTYGEWAAKWWQWAYSIPKKDHPADDNTGEKCAVGQEGPVWFLAGTFGGTQERSCTIPSGKSIMFPILNSENSFAGNPEAKTVDDLEKMNKDFIDKATVLEAVIDGKKVNDIKNYRVSSPLYPECFSKDNIVGFPSNTCSKAVADGYWIILEPLHVGIHEISFKGANSQFTATGITNFATEAKYHITIK
jgi:hypothetical protein